MAAVLALILAMLLFMVDVAKQRRTGKRELTNNGRQRPLTVPSVCSPLLVECSLVARRDSSADDVDCAAARSCSADDASVPCD